jgi:hypothetical protein
MFTFEIITQIHLDSFCLGIGSGKTLENNPIEQMEMGKGSSIVHQELACAVNKENGYFYV